MRSFARVLPLLLLGLASGCGRSGVQLDAPELLAADQESTGEWFRGKTQPAPGHIAKIAPAVLHPVVEVKVAVGDRVKKDQELVKLDDDEPQADVRARKAMLAEMRASLARLKAEPRHEEQNEAKASLESLKAIHEESRDILDRLEMPRRSGAIAEQRYQEARHQLTRARADEAAAAARLARLLQRPYEHEIAELEARIITASENLKSAEAELEHYTVPAMIDGIVTSLDVCVGTVSRPGTTTWGEVLDASVLDVRVDMTPAQADEISQGQNAEVRSNGKQASPLIGKVVYVGIAADPKTGRVPVLVRFDNSSGRLRCYVDAKVRFAAP
jgi:multidrug resistance efflux pump